MNKLFVLGYIWPEPTKTAAGYRLLQLIDLFLDWDYEVVFLSAAKIKATSLRPLESRGIRAIPLSLNDDGFEELLHLEKPNVVLYDRFLVEEQWGWRVRAALPGCLQILDTEDLHFLRNARQLQVEQDIPLEESFSSFLAQREVSSIKRVDLSLIISSYEIDLLKNQFHIPADRLLYIPFLLEEEKVDHYEQNAIPFADRTDFCTIGNLKHAPNLDTVYELKHHIWPKIRQRFPQAQLHIYGAHAPSDVLSLNDTKEGFLIKGHAVSVDKVLSKHRLLLAPLRYGAGLKGKIFDAMINGLPCIMTSVAAEAMFIDSLQAGAICSNNSLFIEQAIQLYEDAGTWNQFQDQGFQILREVYKKSAFAKALFSSITYHQSAAVRERSFEELMLTYHADRHFKYMSHWIKAKKQS